MRQWLALALVAAACGGAGPDDTTGSRSSRQTTTTPPATTAATTTTALRRAPAGPPVLQMGDTGPLVATLRFALECNGYTSPAPGDAFDDGIAGAVSAAQADLGWVPTGTPDLEFFVELSARCPAGRRLAPAGGTTSVVGVAGPDSAAEFLVRAQAGQTLTATVEPATASVGVGPARVAVAAPAGVREWTGRLPATGEYRIAVAVVEPTVFSLRVRLPTDRRATPGTVTIGGDGYGVDSVCVAVAGGIESHWAIFGGGVGRLRARRAGGAAVALAVDLPTGTYEADLGRLTLTRAGDLLAGDGPVGGAPGDVLDVLFAFDVSDAGRCPQLRGDGLGSVAFGASVMDAVAVLAPVLGPPTDDSGWVAASSEGCIGDEVRFVEFGDGLTLTFTDAGSPYAGLGVQHFSFWTAVAPTLVDDTDGVAPGDLAAKLVGATAPQLEADAGTWFSTKGGGAAAGGITYALSGPGTTDEIQAMFAGATPCGR